MVFICQTKSGQSPGIFQFGIQRKRIVLDRQGSAVSGNLHAPRKVMFERGFKIFTPARRLGGHSAEGKRDRSESVAGVEAAASIKAHLFMIEFVEVVKHAADAVAFVVVERLIVNTEDAAVDIEHQILADQAAGICQAIRELLVCGKQEQARSLSTVGADDYGLGLLKMRVALFIKVDSSSRAAIAVQFNAMHIGIRTDLASA